MLFFGYIVSDVKYKVLEDDIVKVVSDVSECTNHLPKLIIGLENAKKYALDNGFDFDILNHSFPNGDMWTFKRTEKREFYEDDIITFKNKAICNQCKNVNYYYIDLYRLPYSRIKSLYNIIMNDEIKYIIIDSNMFYLAIAVDCVIGISFTHLRYIGVDREKTINKLKSKKNNKIYYTNSKNMWKLKDWFSGNEYVIANIFKKNAIKSQFVTIYI